MAGGETIYSSERLLASPRRFAADARADLRVVPGAAWLMWLRGLQARHRQSRLGYGWAVVPALAIAATWAYLDHVRIIRFGDVGIPYLAYVLVGVALWQTFSDALQAPLRRLEASRGMLTKARLPHETWIAAGALDVAFDALLRLIVVAAVLLVAGTPVEAAIVFAPLGLLALMVLGFAVGLAIAPVGLLYEDVGRAVTLVTGFGFFLTPVVYPWPSDLPGTALVAANPVTPILVTTRAWLTGAPGAEPLQLVLVGSGAGLLLLASWIVYRLSRPHIVARL